MLTVMTWGLRAVKRPEMPMVNTALGFGYFFLSFSSGELFRTVVTVLGDPNSLHG